MKVTQTRVEVYNEEFEEFAFKHVVVEKHCFHSLSKHVMGGHAKLMKWRKIYPKLNEIAEYSKANYKRKPGNSGIHYKLRAIPAPKEILDQMTFAYQRPRIPRLVE